MRKNLLINAREIPIEIKHHPRAKHFRVSVFPGGRVLVTIPKRASLLSGELFVEEKAKWIEKQFQSLKDTPSTPHSGDREEYLCYKEQARKFLEKRTSELNVQYGFAYKQIFIRNQKTRWGSCSSNGNLSFHYKVLFLPERQADYIIVHELCHLKEMNHSLRFWKLVARTIPNYRDLRREMRRSDAP